jgi:hypothetical protein
MPGTDSTVCETIAKTGVCSRCQNEKSRPETGRHNKRKNAKTGKWLLSKYQNVSVAISSNPICQQMKHFSEHRSLCTGWQADKVTC